MRMHTRMAQNTKVAKFLSPSGLNSKFGWERTILSHFPIKKIGWHFRMKNHNFARKMLIKNVFIQFHTFFFSNFHEKSLQKAYNLMNRDIFINFPLFKSMFRSMRRWMSTDFFAVFSQPIFEFRPER